VFPTRGCDVPTGFCGTDIFVIFGSAEDVVFVVVFIFVGVLVVGFAVAVIFARVVISGQILSPRIVLNSPVFQ
jgi:flagellar biosynthesis protein FlhB